MWISIVISVVISFVLILIGVIIYFINKKKNSTTLRTTTGGFTKHLINMLPFIFGVAGVIVLLFGCISPLLG